MLQNFGVHNIFIDILHRPHVWCGPYCDIATYPLDLLGIVGSLIVLRRNYLGKIGFAVLLSLLLWPIALFLP
ncbi:hypothetical protein CO051_07005 [Candidatus Roizmanbacteria bacterium CG_4_9_14_0_2_um_filter_39_13]|uniref:BPL/LPL catalytic domain-containing protein n=2 Tax=Candidatus Roizmaniibacteriota TaxID=1752723 RepID=A0A2M8EWD2_9BACT|nr:MAG: hypothetical protein CO051_07005 [Candidatus Roizmanbacteria bacterium CG_4_9_14_0_2_um_filter_39_13]PJE62094.1 MAG: hypothetical protein COU87_01145 [Candidatus Roizmanbacteria bacterium CG10_big_fil_rev_8_21_14_0_10_39_12]